MERNRCAHCRNPIRHGGDVSAPSPGLEQAWFHPDCWATVQSTRQKDYRREVETRGLDALLAPYISAAPAGSKVVGLAVPHVVAHVVAQGNSTEIRGANIAAPIDRPKSA